LETVNFTESTVLQRDTESVSDVYFPEFGILSVSIRGTNGDSVQVSMVGNEGMVGIPLLLGATRSPFLVRTQQPGFAVRLSAGRFKEEVACGGALPTRLALYAQALLASTSQMILCNRHHPLEARFARFLLEIHDRVSGDAFTQTHESFAAQLGVRRATVTGAAGALKRAGLITAGVTRVRILNRAGLESAACECYGVVRKNLEEANG
jgi:CRP-like cAMP-binding protein